MLIEIAKSERSLHPDLARLASMPGASHPPDATAEVPGTQQLQILLFRDSRQGR